MSAIQVTVLNRDGKVLVKFPEPVPIDTTVLEFKRLFNMQVKAAGRTPLSEARLYFTVGSVKGPGLKDKSKTIADYLSDVDTDGGVNFYFKDLGP
jgi:hypothetical protein